MEGMSYPGFKERPAFLMTRHQVGGPLVEPLETHRNRWRGICEGILSEGEPDVFHRG
jgi:hypothetical protein